jgi:serine/threonine protein kinase
VLVALKIIERRNIDRLKMWNQILNEIKIQSYLDHPNIVKLYGFFEEKAKVIQCFNTRCTSSSNIPPKASYINY